MMPQSEKRAPFLLVLGIAFAATVLPSCNSNPGPDAISSRKPAAVAWSCTSTCHNATLSPDPLTTNGTGTAGKHVKHVTFLGLDCDRCHLNYGISGTHMNGTLDTENPAINIVSFDFVNPVGFWTNDAGPGTGDCSSLACHGTEVPPWYGAWTRPDCFVCHYAPIRIRRQITSTGGDFGQNINKVSHHVTGAADPSSNQCLVCHEMSVHGAGTVQVKHADTGAVIAATSNANVETFCLSCHDTNGANTNMGPFADGSTLGAVPYKASVQISTQWNKSYGHRQKGLTCLGNGNPNTGCHQNGHGSGNVGILSLNMTLPLPDRFEDNHFQLCFTCHASYPTVAKEVSFGVRRGGNYDNPYGPFRLAGPSTLTFNDAANTITRDTGSFITDRFIIGNEVVTDAADLANRGAFLIADVTASTLTVTTLLGGDPALVDTSEASKTVTTQSPLYYIPAIQTRFRDQCGGNPLDPPYKDDNCFWWGIPQANLHWFHIGMTAWGYRDNNLSPSGVSCTTCHSVHGTNSQWGMTHDELGYQHNLGLGTDEYGTMSSQLPYTADLFPINCTFACHRGDWWGTTSNWFEPPNE